MEAKGRCFEVAYKFMEQVGRFDKTKKLVHALCEGKGKIKGIKFIHAFVEDESKVYDMTTKQVVYDKKWYYKEGNISITKRYNWKQMIEKANETGHYGYWDKKFKGYK